MPQDGAERDGSPRDGGTNGRAPHARNQALFREVNERIGRFANGSGRDSYICECGDPRCTEPIALTRGEYRAVREHANRFAVLPSHANPVTETVVESHDRYCVVETAGS